MLPVLRNTRDARVVIVLGRKISQLQEMEIEVVENIPNVNNKKLVSENQIQTSE